ncbi:hypothetical protein LTR17_024487 [Elasticomyces elasticus]|nr:hypothetical protein LTR17_024487 [Elasticomyces elasticus]
MPAHGPSVNLPFSLVDHGNRSDVRLRLLTALGTGVLVGTSLVVIIPEGVETLYKAAESSGHVERRGNASYGGGAGSIRDAQTVAPDVLRRRQWPDDDVGINLESDATLPPELSTSASEAPSSDPVHDEEHEHDGDREPHAWVGLSLISGFVLMYLLDTLPQHALSSSKRERRFSISLNSFSFNQATDAEPETPTHTSSGTGGDASRPSSTTIGLVIHGIADGIALGASSTSPSGNRLTFIIFLALMLHKAPAAFGLTSVLLKQGVSKRIARTHLTVFSLAAPLGALFTWAGANLLGYGGAPEGVNMEFWTGVLLLFSGGTFLYVAVHAMQEAGHDSHEAGAESNGNGYLGVSSIEDGGVYGQGASTRDEGKGILDVVATVGGMLVPLLLTAFGHGH